MVPKLEGAVNHIAFGFRAVLFRMVPKHGLYDGPIPQSFRAVLFRMVPKL